MTTLFQLMYKLVGGKRKTQKCIPQLDSLSQAGSDDLKPLVKEGDELKEQPNGVSGTFVIGDGSMSLPYTQLVFKNGLLVDAIIV